MNARLESGDRQGIRRTLGIPGSAWTGGALLTLVVLILTGTLLGYRDVDLWGGIILPVVLFAILAPIIAATERRQTTPLTGVMVGALAARFLGAWVRYLVSFHVYEPTDPLRYHREGVALSRRFWSGELSLRDLVPSGTSTGFIVELSGFVHAFNGNSLLGAFMVFTVLSYLGGALMVNAARLAVPALLTRRYAALVMFLPSMLYWPSSIGKDAPIQLGIGLAAYGAASLFQGRATGWAWATIGTFLAGTIRPHVALLLISAVTLPLLAGRSSRNAMSRPTVRVLGIVVLVFGFTFALGALGDRLGTINYTDPLGSTNSVLSETESRTAIGGSAIESVRANSPLNYPRAAFTVLFRPLLFEADSATTAASAFEGTALLVFAWRTRFNLKAGIKLATANKYIGFVVAYSVVFALAWSSINNLGIIARQRVMMLPLLLILTCVPPASTRRGSEP